MKVRDLKVILAAMPDNAEIYVGREVDGHMSWYEMNGISVDRSRRGRVKEINFFSTTSLPDDLGEVMYNEPT